MQRLILIMMFILVGLGFVGLGCSSDDKTAGDSSNVSKNADMKTPAGKQDPAVLESSEAVVADKCEPSDEIVRKMSKLEARKKSGNKPSAPTAATPKPKVTSDQQLSAGYNTVGLGRDVRSKVPGRRYFKELEAADRIITEQPTGHNTEEYDEAKHTPFKRVLSDPLSTFSADVDTASYSNLRRMLNQNQLPPAGAVRVEEMINYFKYDYPRPSHDAEHPFVTSVEIASCPWAPKHRLARIGIATNAIEKGQTRMPANLVFLIDVSGSMHSSNKLPLVIKSMNMLLENLRQTDRVAIITYAGNERLVLDSTPVKEKEKIAAALNSLRSGGSTNGAAGMKRAYEIAEANLMEEGINRIILCTDGDFNVGTTDRGSLVKMASKKARETGVFMTILGYGMGNYKDGRMEAISNKANGTCAYIDSEKEAKKVLVDEVSATLVTVAKDVKFQIEFNPKKVAGYRLIGYENRRLAAQDFNDDTKDAGEVGAGHTVTALYEIIPAGMEVPGVKIDKLKYQTPAKASDSAASNECFTLKIRYKKPTGKKSILMTFPVTDTGKTIDQVDSDFRFATSVAAAGMLLSDSKFVGNYTLAAAVELGETDLGSDTKGYRKEFIKIMKVAVKLKADTEAKTKETAINE